LRAIHPAIGKSLAAKMSCDSRWKMLPIIEVLKNSNEAKQAVEDSQMDKSYHHKAISRRAE
jgi:hypothetical protein